MRRALSDLPSGRLFVRAGALAVAVWFVALVVLSPLVALLLGDAGDQWQDPSAQIGVIVLLAGVGAVACGLGAVVGVWQAAAAGAQSRRDAVLAGASCPVAVTAVASAAFAEGSLRGVLSALVGTGLAALAAAAAGVAVARRLDG